MVKTIFPENTNTDINTISNFHQFLPHHSKKAGEEAERQLKRK